MIYNKEAIMRIINAIILVGTVVFLLDAFLDMGGSFGGLPIFVVPQWLEEAIAEWLERKDQS
jgi:hypothetical protein